MTLVDKNPSKRSNRLMSPLGASSNHAAPPHHDVRVEVIPREEKPRYAILSHTWEDDEVLYEDARGGSEKLQSCEKAGLSKVLTAAQKAREQKIHYIWIDTCCN